MIKYNNADYKYASAVIRSKERNLLSRDKVEKMLDSKTPEEALRVLQELGYGDGVELPVEEFEELLKLEQKSAYELVRAIMPDIRYSVVFTYPNDYQNVKALLKAEFSNADASGLLTENGSIPVEVLTEAVHNRNYSKVRVDMGMAIQRAIDNFATTQDPQMIDLIMDQACFADIKFEISQFDNTFIKGYVALLIDIINLKSYVRAKQMNKSWDFFAKIFIEGGKIHEVVFTNSYEEPYEQFAEKMEVYGFNEILASGAAALKDTGRFTELEKLCDNLILKYVEDGKYIGYGIENIVGYLTAKEMGIKNARIVLAGKMANIPEDKLRERIRDTYV